MRRRPSHGIPHAVTALFLIICCAVLAFPGGTPVALAATGWQQQVSGTTNLLQGVWAVDANTAWAVGQAGALLKTTDGGATWTPLVPGNNFWGSGVVAVNKDLVWAYGMLNGGSSPGSVFKSVDGGTSWQMSSQLPAESMAAAGTSTAWLSTHQIFILLNNYYYVNNIEKTDDGGASWYTQYSSGLTTDQNNPIGGMSAVNTTTAWAVNNHNILKTTDGATWSKQYDSPRDLYSVSAVDSLNAWVAGDGIVLKTVDGGATWTEVFERTNGTANLDGISAAGPGVAVAAGAEWNGSDFSGVIYRTIDGGVTWNQQARSGTPNLYGLTGVDANTYWAVGLNGTILHTTDGGGLPAVLPLKVTSINPATGVNNANYAVEILGSGFQTGATTRLVQGTTVINGVGVTLTSSGRLTCYFDLTSKPLGKYDVIVKNPDNQEGRLTGGFSVTDTCGQGGGASISVFAGLVGLLSLAGLRMRRKRND